MKATIIITTAITITVEGDNKLEISVAIGLTDGTTVGWGDDTSAFPVKLWLTIIDNDYYNNILLPLYNISTAMLSI